MSSLPSFSDFLIATRDQKFTKKDTLLNEATKQNYFLSRMLKGQDVTKVFKGGDLIKEQINAADAGTFSFYGPGMKFSPTQRNTLKEVSVPWAYAQAHVVYTDEETTLNEGDPDRFLNLKKAYEQTCMVDTINGIEKNLWASPNSDTMENAGAEVKQAYSIPTFVTRDGAVPSAGNGGIAAGSGAWSTIETVPVATNDWFKNAVGTYDVSDLASDGNVLLSEFDRMVNQVQFKMPSALEKWSESDDLKKMVIPTSNDGTVVYKAALRAANDRMDMLKDPAIMGPQFQGIPVEYVSELDNAGWTVGQPDYFFLNLEYLSPFFHNSWYMKDRMKDGGATQPTTNVMYKFTWYNLFCRSRRRQGRLSAVA